MTRTGIRGGNVRSVQGARTLQSEWKPDWTALVDEALREALQRGPTHADDLAHLDLPPEHLNLIGSRIARLVNRGKIVEVGRRKSRNPASNARKSGIFVGVGSVGALEAARTSLESRDNPLADTPDPGEASLADVPPEGSDPPGSSGDRLFELEPVRLGHDRRAA